MALAVAGPQGFYEPINYVELCNATSFLQKFRVSKRTFNILLAMIEPDIAGPVRAGAVMAPSKLYLTLRFLATGSYSTAAADFTDFNESTVYQYVAEVCRAIAKHRINFITLPKVGDWNKVSVAFYELSRFSQVIGVMGYTNVKIVPPDDVENIEVYRNKEGYLSLKVQCVCNPWLKITDLVARWPGSVDDKFIFDNSVLKSRFEAGHFKGFLLGNISSECKPYLMPPVKIATSQSQKRYNVNHFLARNVVEKCFTVMKQRFPALSKGVSIDVAHTQGMIVACAIIHNICIDMHDPLPNIVQREVLNDGMVNIVQANETNLTGSMTGEDIRDGLIQSFFDRPCYYN